MSNTINKSQRDINIQFNKQLEENNKKFQENEIIVSQNELNTYDDEIYNLQEPDEHKKSLEQIIVNSRDLIYKLFELISSGQNPLPFILSTPGRLFTTAFILLMIGCLLLLLSGLMKSKDD